MFKKNKRMKIHPPYDAFMGYLKEHHIPLKELSCLLGGLTIPTISQKNHGWSDYSMTEIAIICDQYKISSEIFRANKILKESYSS